MSTASERAALEAEMVAEKAKLEVLRLKEIGLRADLVSSLDWLSHEAQRAKFKIETRTWKEGCAALDGDWENMKASEEALMECVEEIASAELLIADMQGQLDDAALWVSAEREG